MWRLGLPLPPSVLVDVQRDLQWEDFKVCAPVRVHMPACVCACCQAYAALVVQDLLQSVCMW